jgi:hypothetical protein
VQSGRLERIKRSYESSYNNVKAVRGQNFDESKESLELAALMEQEKTNALVNALSVIVNEFPALGNVIKGSFGDEL